MPMNMPHCRFENTLAELRECHEALAEVGDIAELPESEAIAARKLITVCAEIAWDWSVSGA